MDQSTCLPTFLQSEHRTPQREHSTLLQQEHRTLLPALWQSLAEHPDAAAVYWQEQCIDRRTLLQKCQALARLLGAHGIGNGSRIAVLLPRSPDMLVVLLALWQRGAVYVPLDTAWPRARLEAALTLCAAQCLLTTASLQPLWERCDCPPLLLEPIDYRNTGLLSDDNSAAIPCDAADPAYLLFTSGSSGTPKAVQINHGSLLTLFAGVLPLLALQPGWRVLGCSAFCFDIVFFEWLAPLLCSCSLVLADTTTQRDPGGLLRLMAAAQADVVQATPALWQLLLQDPAAANLQRLQLAIATGEALHTGIARQLLERVPVLWNLYGPTECTVWSSARRVLPDDVRGAAPIVSIGQPLPGYAFQLQPHPELGGDAGELYICGSGVAAGYLGADAAQASRFSVTADGQRCFHSGDLCSRDAQGNYHFLRRGDAQLKINGYRIEAGEIEARLRSHTGIRDAVCLARELAAGSQLLAFVVCEPGTLNKDRERWNRHLQAWLPEWMLPQRYFVLDSLPLDANGKLDRRALLQLAEAGTAQHGSSVDALQAQVARLFCSVLSLDEVGPCDSFFDLGGNSMLSATLLLALNQHFGTQLGLREMLRTPPTVQRLATLLREAGASAGSVADTNAGPATGSAANADAGSAVGSDTGVNSSSA
jgi:enterobactin synthetase component F